MAIIGTFLSRLCAKNHQLNKGSLICVCTEKLKIFPSNISLRVTFKTTGHLIGCTERYRNNPSKTSKTWRNWSLTRMILEITETIYLLSFGLCVLGLHHSRFSFCIYTVRQKLSTT